MNNLQELLNTKTILSRANALKADLTHYYTGKPCKYGHITPRSVLNGTCMECLRLKSTKWYNENTDRHKAYSTQYYKNHPEKSREQSKRHREKTGCAGSARYRASKLNATPKLLSTEHKQEIKKIYSERPKGMHVDHIIPLQGKNVCGLHVPWNLQYLTPTDNSKKGNRLD